jgi:predicted membrane protein
MKLLKSEKQIEFLELIGVIIRISTFGMLSIMGRDTPFFWMWVFNTVDAALLTYCAWKRNNRPYILMNIFWLIVGIIGIYNSL